MTRKQHLSDKDVWQTPQWLVDGIDGAVTIDLDPCAGSDTSIGSINYRLEDGDDGLEAPWFGTVFVNPPFTQKGDWLNKALTERENCECIMFVTPDSTDVQSWWHGKIVPHATYVWFSEGRVKYVDPNSDSDRTSPPFGTAISLFGEVDNELARFLDEHGWLVETVDVDTK